MRFNQVALHQVVGFRGVAATPFRGQLAWAAWLPELKISTIRHHPGSMERLRH
jgi:hypothetical protein